MAAANIELWLKRIIGHEGGYVNHPADPGGETKWGISKRSYPEVDIAGLTINDAAAIYRRDFAEPLGLERMPDGVAFQLFDMAVNSGIQTAIRHLQRAVGVADDGHIGPVTLAAIASKSETDLIMIMVAQRLEFFTALSKWPEFGKGWVRRMAANLRYGAEDS